MSHETIHIHTDGSCLGNPGPGGWAAIIHYNDKEIQLVGGDSQTTNNRMEMTAIIRALEWVRKESKISPEKLNSHKITLFSDSNLIIQTMNQGWKKKANTDLWAEIEGFSAWLNITWKWVKGHASNKYNNLADKLAVKEAEKIQSKHQA